MSREDIVRIWGFSFQSLQTFSSYTFGLHSQRPEEMAGEHVIKLKVLAKSKFQTFFELATAGSFGVWSVNLEISSKAV